MELLTM